MRTTPAPVVSTAPAPAVSATPAPAASAAPASAESAAPQPTMPPAVTCESTAVSSPAETCTTPATVHPMVTRHRDNTRKEKEYKDGTVRYDPRRWAFFAVPTSHRVALTEPAWKAAMADEFAALCQTRTWTLVPRPPGVNVVGSKWIFKTKHRPDGSIDKHKERLVARGFTQQHGIDYG
ncbi:hypothetical protein QYE76_051333 [Lolium multiflorum]|uniref:Reverse transcriptase Ty1/copia-type domain-containing protein n=1 Tax=Lolium multiflorum TaxID=4521 RepID=A0AAD8WI29_LOLMU|nr:hypothetical protein QYE76_051333 [Lolium multiflorum]